MESKVSILSPQVVFAKTDTRFSRDNVSELEI